MSVLLCNYKEHRLKYFFVSSIQQGWAVVLSGMINLAQGNKILDENFKHASNTNLFWSWLIFDTKFCILWGARG